MELTYCKQKEHWIKINYGEPLVNYFEAMQNQDTGSLLIVTNQKYYDLYQSFAMQYFRKPERVNWYVCSNELRCNQLSELQNLLKFLSEDHLLKDATLIPFGNEGVCQLVSFYQFTALKQQSRFLFPTSIASLVHCLARDATIEIAYDVPALQVPILPEKILYESQFIKHFTYGERQRELFVLMKIGFIGRHTFLQELFQTFPTKLELEKKSFTAFLSSGLELLEENQCSYRSFGEVFRRGFNKMEGSHLVSSFSKELIGMILHIMLSQKILGCSFHLPNFIIWLLNLGFPIEIPENILSADITEGILQEIEGQAISLLKKIGGPSEAYKVSEIELLAIVVAYRQLVANIKGDNQNNDILQ